jgi:hypothetical protein
MDVIESDLAQDTRREKLTVESRARDVFDVDLFVSDKLIQHGVVVAIASEKSEKVLSQRAQAELVDIGVHNGAGEVHRGDEVEGEAIEEAEVRAVGTAIEQTPGV